MLEVLSCNRGNNFNSTLVFYSWSAGFKSSYQQYVICLLKARFYTMHVTIKWVDVIPLRMVYLLLKSLKLLQPKNNLWPNKRLRHGRFPLLQKNNNKTVYPEVSSSQWQPSHFQPGETPARLQNNFPSLIPCPEKRDRKLTVPPDHQWLADKHWSPLILVSDQTLISIFRLYCAHNSSRTPI